MTHKGHYGEYSGNAKHSRKTNIWEEEDVKRGIREEEAGHKGHAEALFDDAHGSYNWDGHNSTGAEHGTSRRSSSPLNDEGHGGKPGHDHADIALEGIGGLKSGSTGIISEDKLDLTSGSTSMHEGEKPSPKLVSGDMSFEPHDKDYENYPNPWEEPDYEDPLYKPKDATNFMEKKSAFDNKGEKKFGIKKKLTKIEPRSGGPR